MAFVLGGSALIENLGLSMELSKTLISVLIISFAATTLDTATRIQRMIIAEFGIATNIPIIKNKFVATIFGILPAYLLTLNGTGWKLWPVFGASNQMLAALTLMIITLYFWQRGKPIITLLLPMIFIIIITFISLILKIESFFMEKNIMLLSITLLMFGLIIWMLIEGALSIKNKINR
jgi:carbon starvation protein